MEISASLVRELRDRTGAGMMDCKSALQESNGNLEQAETILRKRDKVKAAKRAERAANQGLVHAYIHGGRIGVLVEVNCETDFAAGSDEFKELVKDIAMQVAASDPRFVAREDVSPAVLDGEREIYRAQVAASGKPEAVLDKIVQGKLETFYKEACLMEQPFVKDTTLTVKDRIEKTSGKIGENVRVRRFVRYRLGEEIAAGTATPAAGGA